MGHGGKERVEEGAWDEAGGQHMYIVKWDLTKRGSKASHLRTLWLTTSPIESASEALAMHCSRCMSSPGSEGGISEIHQIGGSWDECRGRRGVEGGRWGPQQRLACNLGAVVEVVLLDQQGDEVHVLQAYVTLIRRGRAREIVGACDSAPIDWVRDVC